MRPSSLLRAAQLPTHAGHKPTGYEGEGASAMPKRARKTDATYGGMGSRGARTTQMLRADATWPEA